MGRYDLTDFEWSVIEPLMPMDRRGPKPQNNRQVINGMFYILRTGSPWRDLPDRYGPYSSVYNRFNRWRKAAIWDKLMDAIVKAHDGKVQMIDSSIVRVHQHASGVKKRVEFVVSVEAEACSRRRSTLASTPKVRPVKLLISPGNDHDITAAEALLDGLEPRAIVLADKGYDAERSCIHAQGAIPNIPNRSNRKKKALFGHLVEGWSACRVATGARDESRAVPEAYRATRRIVARAA